MTYRMRLRVRIAKPFTTTDTQRSVLINGREVTVRAGNKDQPLSEAKWLVLTTGGFASEADAKDFGDDLRVRFEIVSFCSRLGIDGGNDRPTTWMSEDFARNIGFIRPEERVMPNVHGVMVMPDDGLTRFPGLSATATVSADPAPILSALAEVNPTTASNPRAFTAVRIMNAALMTSEPLAQLVLAFSAVEELGQDETWTTRQRKKLDDLAASLEAEAVGEPELREVGTALRSLHRLSLRQGAMRMLSRLGLKHLRKDWDRLYGIRSGIFHGTKRLNPSENAAFANEVLALCGKVIVMQLRQDGIEPPAIAATHFYA
jgi:hypothetical protein